MKKKIDRVVALLDTKGVIYTHINIDSISLATWPS